MGTFVPPHLTTPPADCRDCRLPRIHARIVKCLRTIEVFIALGRIDRSIFSTKIRQFGRAKQGTPYNSQTFIASIPLIDATGSQLIEALASVNQQIVAGLARQNLSYCHTDAFTGDPTLVHPWKAAS